MTTKAPPRDEELPCDLLEFIALRSGVDVEVAAALVGDFLIRYEPKCAPLPRAPASLAA